MTTLFQSPEGDSLFFYAHKMATVLVRGKGGFQSPEGDSLFFYVRERDEAKARAVQVSVPRRGFVVFLPMCLFPLD